jgi:hypothetical protein
LISSTSFSISARIAFDPFDPDDSRRAAQDVAIRPQRRNRAAAAAAVGGKASR